MRYRFGRNFGPRRRRKAATAPSGVTWTPGNNSQQDGGGSPSSLTFASMSFPATGTGIVRVACANRKITSVTVAGVSCTLVCENNSAASATHVSIWSTLIAASGAKTVVIAASVGFMGKAWIDTGVLTGANATPTATTAKTGGSSPDPQVMLATLTCPANGIILSAAYGGQQLGTITWESPSINETVDTTYGASGGASGVHFLTAKSTSNDNPSFTGFNNTFSSGCAAAFGP